METDMISLMQRLAPDLTEEMARRALILERIHALQPVGRRQLAAALRMPEREIRNTAALLKELGYLELNASGMSLTEQADGLIPAADAFSRALSGITEMEIRLSSLLPVEDVVIARGNADTDLHVLNDVGRLCAARLRSLLLSGETLAVTGGRTIAAVAQNLQPGPPLNVMVVPARGGMGRSAELQANTLASAIANRLGGHYRLIHLPDHLDPTALQELIKLPEISEVMDLISRADVVLHGISDARDALRDPRLSRKEQAALRDGQARGECFGCFFDPEGRLLLRLSSVGVDPERRKRGCRMVAAAAGESKAEAIIAALRHDRHRLLVTDEGAAEKMLRLLEDDILPSDGLRQEAGGEEEAAHPHTGDLRNRDFFEGV